ncbi:MAG TPA: HD domain-containing phosphohydrolase [Gemmatimonadaceae bacterium]|nr:HD domain-containing phosphohydrolase [Gemmatimonadaceae bacterium]
MQRLHELLRGTPLATLVGAAAGVRPAPLLRPLLLVRQGRVVPQPVMALADGVEIRRVPALPEVADVDPLRPTVVLLDRAVLMRLAAPRVQLTALAAVASLVVVGDPGDREPAPDLLDCCPEELLSGFVAADARPTRGELTRLRGAFRTAAALSAGARARAAERDRQRELTELSSVGAALGTERDLLTLLDMILSQARRITGSDAGSLYLVERDGDTGPPKALRFRLAQNHSLPDLTLGEYTVPLDHTSVAGYAAATGKPVVIADAARLPRDAAYRLNRSFDERSGYRTKSMLVIPMTTQRDEVVGVLQLINRKRNRDATLDSAESTEREVLAFDDNAVELARALAAQGAVAIENSLLYESIERLFEGFVTASVTAIEQRDPTTFGHSARVAQLTVRLAESVATEGRGAYRGMRFSQAQLREIRYAGLLHDIGKVGVRESVLVKQKKLYPDAIEAIGHRFAFLIQAAELEFERARAKHLLEHGRERYDAVVRELESALRKRRLELEQYHRAIVAACEPTVVPEGSFGEVIEVAGRTFLDMDGEERALLSPCERRQLSIRQGTLDEDERREVESHVDFTFRFLQQIPWTPELRNVPEIARAHHEKLDGSGYPRGVTGAEIPVQTRMMTIADIYDALTATDRPYKRAVPRDRALDILSDEARRGELDTDLVATFVAARVWEASSDR